MGLEACPSRGERCRLGQRPFSSDLVGATFSPRAEKEDGAMVRFEQRCVCMILAQGAGQAFRFPIASKTTAKTTTKTV
jgi:hypothetical protein